MKCKCGNECIPGKNVCRDCLKEIEALFDDMFCCDDLKSDSEFGSDELKNIITLKDELGNDLKYEFLDLINYYDEEYVVLLPDEDDSGEVLILKVENDGEDESYVSVEAEETLNTVFEIFKEKNKDRFGFSEEG